MYAAEFISETWRWMSFSDILPALSSWCPESCVCLMLRTCRYQPRGSVQPPHFSSVTLSRSVAHGDLQLSSEVTWTRSNMEN